MVDFMDWVGTHWGIVAGFCVFIPSCLFLLFIFSFYIVCEFLLLILYKKKEKKRVNLERALQISKKKGMCFNDYPYRPLPLGLVAL